MAVLSVQRVMPGTRLNLIKRTRCRLGEIHTILLGKSKVSYDSSKPHAICLQADAPLALPQEAQSIFVLRL